MEDHPQIRAIIFDLGGVLLRTDDAEPRTALAQRLGISRAKLEEIVFSNPVSQKAESGRAAPDEVWAEVRKQLGLPQTEMAELVRQFFGGDRVDFSLIALIQSLRPAYTTALLSNTWVVDLAAWVRDELHIPDTFDVIISSAQQGVAKPDAEIYQRMLQLVDARPEQALFVDDNERNIQAAAALGINVIHFRGAEQARRELLEWVRVGGE